MKRGFADTVHGQIHYLTAGQGDPVVLLHITPISSDEFAHALPILGEKYRAVAMDTLGYGDSDKPTRQYTLREYAGSVVDLLDALDVGRTALVGTHTGAGIAAEVAAAFPDRVSRLIVDGYPLFTEEELAVRRRGVPEKLRRTEPLDLMADGSHLMDTWNQVVEGLGMDPENDTEDVHRITTAILKSGPRNLEAHIALWDYDPAVRLPLIKCPTLILSSSQDEFCARAEETRQLIPGSEVRIVPGGGLIFPFMAPRDFAAAVMSFLRESDS